MRILSRSRKEERVFIGAEEPAEFSIGICGFGGGGGAGNGESADLDGCDVST